MNASVEASMEDMKGMKASTEVTSTGASTKASMEVTSTKSSIEAFMEVTSTDVFMEASVEASMKDMEDMKASVEENSA